MNNAIGSCILISWKTWPMLLTYFCREHSGMTSAAVLIWTECLTLVRKVGGALNGRVSHGIAGIMISGRWRVSRWKSGLSSISITARLWTKKLPTVWIATVKISTQQQLMKILQSSMKLNTESWCQINVKLLHSICSITLRRRTSTIFPDFKAPYRSSKASQTLHCSNHLIG